MEGDVGNYGFTGLTHYQKQDITSYNSLSLCISINFSLERSLEVEMAEKHFKTKYSNVHQRSSILQSVAAHTSAKP